MLDICDRVTSSKLIISQILSHVALALMYLHQLDVPHGNLNANSIIFSDSGHVKIWGYEHLLIESILEDTDFDSFFLDNIINKDEDHNPSSAMYISSFMHQTRSNMNHSFLHEVPPERLRNEVLSYSMNPMFIRDKYEKKQKSYSRGANHPYIPGNEKLKSSLFAQDVYYYGWLVWQLFSIKLRPYQKNSNITNYANINSFSSWGFIKKNVVNNLSFTNDHTSKYNFNHQYSKSPEWMRDDILSGTISYHQSMLGFAFGYLPPPELNIETEINQLISWCTRYDPNERPNFETICPVIDKIYKTIEINENGGIESYLMGFA